jgi:hypothetical protein
MQHFELLIIPESLLLTLWNHLLSQNAPFTSSLLEKILNFLKCQDTPLCGGWLVLFDHSMQDYTVMKCPGKMLTVTTYSRKSPCRMHTAGGAVKEVVTHQQFLALFGHWLQLFVKPQDRSYSRATSKPWYNMSNPDKWYKCLGCCP